MKARSFLVVVTVLLCAVTLIAQQTKMSVATTTSPAKTPTDSAAAKPAKAPAKTAVKNATVAPVSGDAAYKANCTRCHSEPKKFSERKMATIMQHMRVRANMTEAETQAILRYLTK